MEKIIKELYRIDLSQNLLPLLKTDRDKAIEEWNCYNELFEKIPQESRRLFLKYINIRANRECVELEKAYTCGFKTAMKLLKESFKE